MSDYFAGCGGTHLGFSEAGFRTLYALDYNAWAARLFRLNFPDVPYYEVDIRQFVPSGPAPDGVLATFPCDDFSLLNTVTGLDGEQSGLFAEVLRQIDLLAPKRFVFIENVAHLMRARNGRDRAMIQEQLARRGFPYYYDAVVDGLGYVPQKRSRYIAFAFRENVPFKFPAPPAESPLLGSIMEPDEQVPDTYNWTEKMARYFRERKGRHSNPILGRPDSLYGNTLTENGYKGNQGSPIYTRPDGTLRKFTERELAGYMGFPDWYQLGNLSWSRLVQVLGNSVIPPLIAALARQAKAALEAADLRRLLPRLVRRPVVQLALPC